MLNALSGVMPSKKEGEEILDDHDVMEGKVRVVIEENGTPTPFVFAAALEAVAEARGILSDLDTMEDLRHWPQAVISALPHARSGARHRPDERLSGVGGWPLIGRLHFQRIPRRAGQSPGQA